MLSESPTLIEYPQKGGTDNCLQRQMVANYPVESYVKPQFVY